MTLKNEEFEAVYEALYGKDALAEAKARVIESIGIGYQFLLH